MSFKGDKLKRAKSRHKTSSELQGERFAGAELRAQVLGECRKQFEALTGQPWTDDRARRIRGEIEGAERDNDAEEQAYKIIGRLIAVLEEITAFTGIAPPDANGKFPRLDHVSGGYGVARFLLEWANKYHWRLVPTLDPIREVVKRSPPAREDRLSSFLARYGRRFWPRGPGRGPPGPRELAILSLLAGQFPSTPERTTVADVITRQTKAIREAMRRAEDEAERLNNSPEMQALAQATGIPPTALALLGAYRRFETDPEETAASPEPAPSNDDCDTDD